MQGNNFFKFILITCLTLVMLSPVQVGFFIEKNNSFIAYSATKNIENSQTANTDTDEYNQELSEIYKPKKTQENTQIQTVKPPSFLRMFFSLLFVIVLMMIFAWGYAKFKGLNPNALITGKFSNKNKDLINILSTATLGQGKNIHLIEVNEKKLLIGSTLNNINLLTEFNNDYDTLFDYSNAENHHDSKDLTDSQYFDAHNQELYKEYLRKNIQ